MIAQAEKLTVTFSLERQAYMRTPIRMLFEEPLVRIVERDDEGFTFSHQFTVGHAAAMLGMSLNSTLQM